ncbi:MAG: hypothetical protein DRJ35_01285 [Thermoprotei archaeon]|nr:MAG: hypothetical protein DRJ35_01285 [Thermoprotei archaeon]
MKNLLEEQEERVKIPFRRDLLEAARDFYFLLNRGYKRKSSLDLVSSRYLLSREERLILYRSIFSREISENRLKKLVNVEDIRGKIIVVDVFNLTSTTVSSMLRDTLVLGTDRIIRDIAATRRKIRYREIYISGMIISFLFIYRFSPLKVIAVFDAPISKSAEFAVILKEICKNLDMDCEVILSKHADTDIIRLSGVYDAITVSSDSVVIDKVERIVDLGGLIANILSHESIIEIGESLR